MNWRLSKSLGVGLLLCSLRFECLAETEPSPKPSIGILSLSVDGREVKQPIDQPLRLSAFPGSVDINFGPVEYREKQPSDPIRIRYKLEGVDDRWRESDGPANVMRISLGFLDQYGNELMHEDFEARGQSPGWTGDFETSPLQHRREQIGVPLEASSFWVVISSAGAPGVVGAYFVGNLTVRVQNPTNAPAVDLVNMAFNPWNNRPVGWVRDGPRANMAKVLENGREKLGRGLAIVDDNANAHAQWNTPKAQGPTVTPLDTLVLEWDEMFSIGLAPPATVSYKNLKPGFYRFSLERLSIMGEPIGDPTSFVFEVLAPFWKTAWFWISAMSAMAAVVFAGWRYQISRQLKLENARLAQQQVLEAERFRISRDIHDDFGARVTQISLLSSSAQQREGLSPEVRADFSAVTEMSRNLVGSLYETVWAISPENDHLDSLATYICQVANQLCAQAGLKCRLQIPDLPHEIPVSSSIRHNLVMAVKEAINNIIKHAGANEVQIKVHFENGLLAIEVRDNGKGFDTSIRRRGNGLANMERRMKSVGGCWTKSSKPGEGTSVRLEVRLSGNGGTINRAPAAA